MRVGKRGQEGQAVAELLIGILAVAAAFLGLLFISALGLVNIENLVTARSSADLLSLAEPEGDSGATALVGWESGNDELYFTPDDKRMSGGEGDGNFFINQLISTDAGYDLTQPVEIGAGSYSRPFKRQETDQLFVSAAGLVSATQSESDPLAARGLSDLKDAFKFLLEYDPDFNLTETVFMPSISSSSE